ncbi:zinc ABC transporter substrate-binding protein [soil metagenome]
MPTSSLRSPALLFAPLTARLTAVPMALLMVLAGCSATAPYNAADGVLRVVASTSVYGDLASAIGGSRVEVTSIIHDPNQDPHQFEANGRVQLALSRADVVIVNGGGYDDFATTMLAASGNTDARVIDAVYLSGHDVTSAGFNEHVWYDYPTVITVVKAIAAALDIADPDNASSYDAMASVLVARVGALETLETSVASVAHGAGVVITEPVPLYALTACGLTNVTPPAFSEAIEADIDAPPLLLQSVLDQIAEGSAAVVVYNAQTGGPQTEAVLAAATTAGVPTIGVTEIPPSGTDYVAWQTTFLTDLLTALAT